MNWQKIIIVVTIIVVGVLVYNWLDLGTVWYYFSNRICVKSHQEQSLKPPMTVNLGGRDGFSVGIPLGSIKMETETVCDEYSYPTKKRPAIKTSL